MKQSKPYLLLAITFLLAHSSFGQNGRPLDLLEEEKLFIEFEPQGGFFEEGQNIELLSSDPSAKIFYTLDGGDPNESGALRYKGPILVSKTAIIRAVVVKGADRTKIKANTYFINEPATKLAVVSLGIPPGLLFDPDRGLFVKGDSYDDSHWSLPGANFWNRGEYSMNTEVFIQNKCVFRSGAGFRLFGGMSRLFPQKSLAVVTRKKYGKKRIKYPLFGKSGLDDFKFLVLRNSGSDFDKAHFRDLMMTSLVEKWDLEKQDGRPAHVYINGYYWGIYNIREKVNRYFIADHNKGVDKDSIDLLEHRMNKKKGRISNYKNMLEFLEEEDLSSAENFNALTELMDVENFMDFQIAQIYFDNRDAGGNIKFWRPQTPSGKWRWVLYDTDFGFGLHDKNAFKFNTVDFHTEADGPKWPNPPWSTFILRKLLANKNFETAFVNRFADHLNYSFKSSRVQSCINFYYRMLEPEIGRHHKRWNLNHTSWENQVRIIRDFAESRPENIRWHLMDKFETGKMRNLQLASSNGGKLLLNNYIEVSSTANYSGVYFENYPVQLRAEAERGFIFSHWEKADGKKFNQEDKEFEYFLEQDSSYLKAVFKEVSSPYAGLLVINEISTNNPETGDWIELFNNSDAAINLEGCFLYDDKNSFALPDAIIGARDYLIICQNETNFLKSFPLAYNTIGDFNFGLNKRKEQLAVYGSEGALIDEFKYSIPAFDTLFTLSLLDPSLNNLRQSNWELVYDSGSPNQANNSVVLSKIQGKRNFWIRFGAFFAVIIIAVCLLILRKNNSI
jgi:hypothetical protein